MLSCARKLKRKIIDLIKIIDLNKVCLNLLIVLFYFNLFFSASEFGNCSFIFQTVSAGRRRFSANFQLVFRLIKFLIFVTFLSILVTLIALPHMTLQDIIVCFLAFMPTGWGILMVSHLQFSADLSTHRNSTLANSLMHYHSSSLCILIFCF